MDKRKLRQYRALQKEIPSLRKKLNKLYNKRLDIPVVSGKVTGSSHEFPYIEEHITVQMDEPKESDILGRRIKTTENRLNKAEKDLAEIEEFITSISDSTDRQIFESVYLEKTSQKTVAEDLGYSEGRISQIIGEYLKD